MKNASLLRPPPSSLVLAGGTNSRAEAWCDEATRYVSGYPQQAITQVPNPTRSGWEARHTHRRIRLPPRRGPRPLENGSFRLSEFVTGCPSTLWRLTSFQSLRCMARSVRATPGLAIRWLAVSDTKTRSRRRRRGLGPAVALGFLIGFLPALLMEFPESGDFVDDMATFALRILFGSLLGALGGYALARLGYRFVRRSG